MNKKILNDTEKNTSFHRPDPVVAVSIPLSVEGIQDWLAEQISEQIGVEAGDIDIHTTFHSYGLQSVQATEITSLGRQRFGVEISPLTIWNCPNIALLSEHIASELNQNEQELFEI